jgi:hypothetical protein
VEDEAADWATRASSYRAAVAIEPDGVIVGRIAEAIEVCRARS